MLKQNQKFGRLSPAYISYERVHHGEVSKAEQLQNRQITPRGEKIAVWTAYFTLVFATIVIFSPEAAIAAVQTAKELIL